MRKKLKFFVSTENKILLHLKRFVKVDSTKKVPNEIIQVGIANNLGSPRGSISRALGNLISKGFVEEKLCRVEASKRRMNAYFLTWEGRSQVEVLEQKLSTELLEVRLEDESLSEVTVSEALDLSEDSITTSELLRLVEIHGFYDPRIHKVDFDEQSSAGDSISSITEDQKSAEGETDTLAAGVFRPGEVLRKEVLQFVKVPQVRTFYGRTRELSEFPNILKEYPVFIIRGMAGLGKTTLAAKVATQLDPTWKIYWYRLQEWDTGKSLLQGFAEFFNAYGHSLLLSELNAYKHELDMYKITKIIVSEFHSLKALLVIDDFHRASDSVKQLFSALIEHINSKSLVHLLIITRAHLPIFDQRDTKLKKIVYEVQLEGLDRESSREMLGTRKLTENDFKKIYSITNGHPLALELIKSTGSITDFSDMMKFIKEQVFQKLAKDEKNLISSISVHRKPSTVEGFLIENEADFDTMDELINKSLLVEAEPSCYTIHDLIKEFFYSRMMTKTKETYHRHAAEFYEAYQKEDLDILEAVYHYIQANDMDKAAEIMVIKAPSLIDSGYLDEAMNILTRFDSTVSSNHLAELYRMRGDILSTWGEWDNVFEYYWQCYFITMFEKDKDDKKKLLESFGYIGWKPSEVEVALTNLNSSLEVLNESGDKEGITEIENNLAWLNWMTGSHKDAVDLYKKLFEKMEKDNDKLGSAKIQIKLGNVFWSELQLDQALKSYKDGLELFKSVKDNYGVARAHSNIGIILIEQGEFKKAKDNLKKCIALSEKIQFKKGLAYAKMHSVQNLMMQELYNDALAELEAARAIFQVLNDPLGLAYLTALEGYILKHTKQNKRAIGSFESGLHYTRGFLMPYYKSKLYNELGALYKLTGESDKAAEAKAHALEKEEQKLE